MKEDNQTQWPKEITESLSGLLGTMCFQFIELARLWRDTGTDIPKKAEAEQSFFLHAMLKHWFEHGDDWREHWANEVGERIAKIREQRPPAQQDRSLS